MALNDYFRIEKPEDKDKQHAEQHCSVESVHAAFSLWSHVLLKTTTGYPGDETCYHQMLEEAEHFLPKKLPAIISDTSYFKPIETLPETHRPFAGLFYTAMLQRGVEKIIVPKCAENIGLWGYAMKQGTLEVLADSRSIGREAEGGICINHGIAANFAYESSGGIFINHNIAIYCGWDSEATIINHAKIKVPYFHNALCINYGTIGYFTRGCVYIDSPKICTFLSSAFRGKLRVLFNRLRKATKKDVDIDVDMNHVNQLTGEIHLILINQLISETQ